MIVLIDNYDSFSYNVYQLIGSVEPDIKVVRNDEYTVKEIEAMRPEADHFTGPRKTVRCRNLHRGNQIFCRKTSDSWDLSGTSGNL